METLTGNPERDMDEGRHEPEDKDFRQAMNRLTQLEEDFNSSCDRCGVHICSEHAKIAEEIEAIKTYYHITD